jgi:hypothetical protein
MSSHLQNKIPDAVVTLPVLSLIILEHYHKIDFHILTHLNSYNVLQCSYMNVKNSIKYINKSSLLFPLMNITELLIGSFF